MKDRRGDPKRRSIHGAAPRGQKKAEGEGEPWVGMDILPPSPQRSEELLDLYARFLVEHTLHLEPGQALYLRAQVCHRDLALRVGEAAYDLGERQVHYRFADSLQSAQLIRRSAPAEISAYLREIQAWYGRVTRTGSAFLLLTGCEFPDLLPALATTHPTNHAAFARRANRILMDFQRRSLHQHLCPCTSAAGPTTAWARSLYPHLEPEAARGCLLELIVHCTRAEAAATLTAGTLERRDRLLAERCRILDDLEIFELHLSGGGTDLRVGLSPRARWQSGLFHTRAGQPFYPNVPSEEIFTSPDHRRTEGRLVASRPLRLGNGARVENLVLWFEKGEVVAFEASIGREAFARWLELDAGARRLGEVALVAGDSPLARFLPFYDHLLYDENAAAHLALGQALPFALAGGERLAAAELDSVGFNRSLVHTDIPFGSSAVDVIATRCRAGVVPLLEEGAWAAKRLLVPKNVPAEKVLPEKVPDTAIVGKSLPWYSA